MEYTTEGHTTDDTLNGIRDLFSLSPAAYGSLASPTQHGFLALAKAGKTTWNAWRKKYPDASPNFSGATFEQDAKFSGFIFSERSQECYVDFSGAKFLKRAFFRTAKFEGQADFRGVTFCEESDFSECSFGDDTDFTGATFAKSAKFIHASFGAGTQFDNSEFRSTCHFKECKFGYHPSFFRAKFGRHAFFSDSEFGSACTFNGAEFGKTAQFTRITMLGDCDFASENKENTPASARAFYTIDFDGAFFSGNANFTSREFRSRTNFGKAPIRADEKSKSSAEPPKPDRNTIFVGIPSFHQCKFNQDTSFDGAEFRAPPSLEAARAYRTLKLAMEQLKATREEQKFFRLEMKAEHPSLPFGKRWISTIYSLFSDYGFSLWRPIVWLFALSLAFGAGYGLLANACAADTDCAQTCNGPVKICSGTDRTSAVIKYTLASVSPVPGLDKMQTELRAPLFGHHGWIPITALVLEILHKIVALVMAFLFALALRNLFKMKS